MLEGWLLGDDPEGPLTGGHEAKLPSVQLGIAMAASMSDGPDKQLLGSL